MCSQISNQVPHWESVFKPTYTAKSIHYESNTESTQYNAVSLFFKFFIVVKLKLL
jgi:hypothetical protein